MVAHRGGANNVTSITMYADTVFPPHASDNFTTVPITVVHNVDGSDRSFKTRCSRVPARGDTVFLTDDASVTRLIRVATTAHLPPKLWHVFGAVAHVHGEVVREGLDLSAINRFLGSGEADDTHG